MQFKGVKTKSAFSARVQRSFGLRMPSSSLHRWCDSLARSSSFFNAVFFQPMRFFLLFSSPFLSLGFFLLVLKLFSFFLHWCCPVWRLPVPILLYWGSWLGCAVVPVMDALFQSRGWLSIVEAPGYSRHPTSILAMQLLKRGWRRGERTRLHYCGPLFPSSRRLDMLDGGLSFFWLLVSSRESYNLVSFCVFYLTSGFSFHRSRETFLPCAKTRAFL